MSDTLVDRDLNGIVHNAIGTESLTSSSDEHLPDYFSVV